MNKNCLCFKIENRDLYLDKVLIDFDDAPILFTCESEDNQKWIILMASNDWDIYYIVKTNNTELKDMLMGAITMRSIFTSKEIFWKVITQNSDVLSEDIVEKLPISKMDFDALPIEDAYYEILTKDIKEYTDSL